MPRPFGVFKLKWTTRRGTAGIQVHADPATAASSAGWVGLSAWCGRLGLGADLLSRQTRAEEMGLAGASMRLGPLRLRFGCGARGPDVVGRVLADLLTARGPNIDPFAELKRQLPWACVELDPRARLVRPWWWPASVAEAVRRAAEAGLRQPVELKRAAE